MIIQKQTQNIQNHTNAHKNSNLRKKAEEFCSVFISEMLKQANTSSDGKFTTETYNSMLSDIRAKSIMKNKSFQKGFLEPMVRKWEEKNQPIKR